MKLNGKPVDGDFGFSGYRGESGSFMTVTFVDGTIGQIGDVLTSAYGKRVIVAIMGSGDPPTYKLSEPVDD